MLQKLRILPSGNYYQVSLALRFLSQAPLLAGGPVAGLNVSQPATPELLRDQATPRYFTVVCEGICPGSVSPCALGMTEAA